MPRVDFLISNDRHHVEMFQPLVARLSEDPGYRCHVVSLCELRGLRSPVERFDDGRIEFTRIPQRIYRPSPASGSRSGGLPERVVRTLARAVAWRQWIRPGLGRWSRTRPDLVVLPNDGAFPYDRIVRLLRGLGIPSCLVQEGIKFRRTRYGTGGTDAVAAWGENSAAFFRSQGVPPDRIHMVGNPRYERVLARDWREEARAVAARHRLGRNVLLFASNPIDDLGMCTTREKHELVRHFVHALEPLFDDSDLHLVIRPHPRESATKLSRIAAESPHHARISVLQDEPLYPLLAAARAAVVLASSVGVDALLLRVPLGVLEIPGHGFAFDYVSSGAALGLSPDGSMADQVRVLLAPGAWDRAAGEAYLERNLKAASGSTELVLELIQRLVQA